MASLPPGWKADYDGERWFFTYGPTGQSQFQFPRPGDEFPDFWCCAGGGPDAAAARLPPEEMLESERQVRRMLNASGGSGGAEGEGEVVGEKGDVCRRASPVCEEGGGDGEGNVCFASFAAGKSRGGLGLGGSREGSGPVEQRGQGVGDGVGVPPRTSVVGVSEESTGDAVSVPLVTKVEHTPATSPPHRAEGSATTIAIMSEPVLAVVETAPAAPSLGHQGEHQPAAVARSSSPGLPMLDGRAIDSAQKALTALSVVEIPELYSESTALCEVEINPPPVELPGNEGGWGEHALASNLAIQNPVELPAYEGRSMSSGKESTTAGLEPKSCLAMAGARDHAVISKAGPEGKGGGVPGYDRAALPSQASRVSSKITLGKTSRRDSVDSVPGQRPGPRSTGHTADNVEAERRDLTHFPSVLRPGPRRSSQPPLQQQRAAMPAPVINTSHAACVPEEHPHEGRGGAGSIFRGEAVRMPAMPVSETTSTTSPGVPRADGARQNRLPSSVNFVIPIQHITGNASHPGQDITAAGASPNCHVSAPFASVTSSEQSHRAGGQSGEGSPGLLPPGGKSEPWNRRPADGAAVSARVVNSRSAPAVPDWSWGHAR